MKLFTPYPFPPPGISTATVHTSTVHPPQLQYIPAHVLQYSPHTKTAVQTSIRPTVQSTSDSYRTVQHMPCSTIPATEQSSTRPTVQSASHSCRTVQHASYRTMRRHSYRTVQHASYNTVHSPKLQNNPANFLQYSPPATATVQTSTRPTVHSSYYG
jgi:hypothetical protein